MQPRVPERETKASKLLAVKTYVVAGKTPNLTGEFIGETHRFLEHTQAHLPGNQHQKGPIFLWGTGEVTESWPRVKQVALFPLNCSP